MQSANVERKVTTVLSRSIKTSKYKVSERFLDCFAKSYISCTAWPLSEKEKKLVGSGVSSQQKSIWNLVSNLLKPLFKIMVFSRATVRMWWCERIQFHQLFQTQKSPGYLKLLVSLGLVGSQCGLKVGLDGVLNALFKFSLSRYGKNIKQHDGACASPKMASIN